MSGRGLRRRAAKSHPALQFGGGSGHRPGIGATLDRRSLALLRGISGKIGARFLEFLRRHAANKQEGARHHQPSRFPGGLQLCHRVRKRAKADCGLDLCRSTENYTAPNLGSGKKNRQFLQIRQHHGYPITTAPQIASPV
ncbi:MAG: hypothetical protein ACXWLJ_09530 [Rhizomicrobium sp.]